MYNETAKNYLQRMCLKYGFDDFEIRQSTERFCREVIFYRKKKKKEFFIRIMEGESFDAIDSALSKLKENGAL